VLHSTICGLTPSQEKSVTVRGDMAVTTRMGPSRDDIIESGPRKLPTLASSSIIITNDEDEGALQKMTHDCLWGAGRTECPTFDCGRIPNTKNTN